MHVRPLDPAASDLLAPVAPVRAAEALAAWRDAATAVELARATTKNREHRLDLDRRAAALGRQREAIDARLARGEPARTVVLVAHRDRRSGQRLAESVRDALRAGLRADDPGTDALLLPGLDALDVVDNGADAVGAAVVGQPRLVVVDAPLPMMTALDVVHEIGRYAPGARIAACADGTGAAALRQAGAAWAYTGRPMPEAVLAALLEPEGRDGVPEPRP